MKDLSDEEFKKAPHKVKFVYLMAFSNIPIGSVMYEEVLREYPEYFPDEVEKKRKYNAIPQSVHDAYREELSLIRKEVYKDLPKSESILDGHKEWHDAYAKCRPIEIELEKELHKKHYTQYGI